MRTSSQGGRAAQRARTRAVLVDGALQVLSGGRIPSVTDAAAATGVSRATAYRYFPDAASLLSAVLQETVTPLRWAAGRDEAPDDPVARIETFLDEALPIIHDGDAQLRAALRVALEQRAGVDAAFGATPVQRGTRIGYLRDVLAPLRADLDDQAFERLVAAVATIVGIEAHVVLRDLCGLSPDEAGEVVRWMARTLVESVARSVSPSG